MTAHGPANGEYVLLSDAPPAAQDGIRARGVPDSAAPPDDVLGFTEVAGRMAELIVDSRQSTPLALGVLGGWGSGKSTLMRYADAALVDRRRVAGAKVETVWFNAWVTEGTEVLEGLIKLVLTTIGPKVVRRAVRNQRLMSGLRLGATLVLSWFGAGRLVDSVWSELSGDGKARNDLRDLLADAMRDWRRRQAARGERVLVIFVDDLDRCSPDKVVDVFEAIKVYLDEPGFVFVIGYDQAMVGSAVRADKSLDALRAAQYLEKIVQIEYRVPRPDDGQARALLNALVDGSGTADLLGDSERTLIMDRTDRNPRRVKRFLNNFVLSQRLDCTADHFTPVEHIKILLLRMYFPDFYELLFEDGERDAITEFLDYARYEESVQRGKPLPDDETRAIFHAFRRSAPTAEEPAETALARLRQVVPEVMVPLSGNADFRSLVESLGDPDARRDLLDRVRGRRETFETVPTEEPATITSAAGAAMGQDVLGMRVLWIDDVPENNNTEVMELNRRGAHVVQARTLTDAEVALASTRPFDLLISDVARHGDADAGFKDLQKLQERRLYQGPVFFYTSRITAERRQRAEELGALGIGGNIAPALAFLEQLASTRLPPPPDAAPESGIRKGVRAAAASRGPSRGRTAAPG